MANSEIELNTNTLFELMMSYQAATMPLARDDTCQAEHNVPRTATCSYPNS